MVTRRLTIPIQGMTCAGCVARVEETLRTQPGVVWATVNFAAAEATIIYDPAGFALAPMLNVIRRLGYAVSAQPALEGDPGAPILWPRVRRLLPDVASGCLAALALLAFYVGLVTVAQDWDHALGLLWTDRWLVGAIAAGFGTQVGLYVHLRRLQQERRRMMAPGAWAAAGTGASSVAMLACCAHHLVDVLPIVGPSAAAIVLNQYRAPMMLAGIATNLVGIGVMVRLLRQEQRQRQSPAGADAADKQETAPPVVDEERTQWQYNN